MPVLGNLVEMGKGIWKDMAYATDCVLGIRRFTSKLTVFKCMLLNLWYLT